MIWLAAILLIYGGIYFFIIRKIQKETEELEVLKRMHQQHLKKVQQEAEELQKKVEKELKNATEEEKKAFWDAYLKEDQ